MKTTSITVLDLTNTLNTSETVSFLELPLDILLRISAFLTNPLYHILLRISAFLTNPLYLLSLSQVGLHLIGREIETDSDFG